MTHSDAPPSPRDARERAMCRMAVGDVAAAFAESRGYSTLAVWLRAYSFIAYPDPNPPPEPIQLSDGRKVRVRQGECGIWIHDNRMFIDAGIPLDEWQLFQIPAGDYEAFRAFVDAAREAGR